VPAFIDETIIAGAVSSPVMGFLSADEALAIMLAGTGFRASYNENGAFMIEPHNAQHLRIGAPDRPKASLGASEKLYVASVQEALSQVLCAQLPSERIAFQLWIMPDGRVRAVHMLANAGKREHYAALLAALRSARAQPPEPGLRQPITLVLAPQPDEPLPCRQTAP
jgi:hypothetical protein